VNQLLTKNRRRRRAQQHLAHRHDKQEGHAGRGDLTPRATGGAHRDRPP
jgi:hypothetical protein